jgi:hypothetical protein
MASPCVLSIKTTNPAITRLGIDVKGFVLNVVVSLFEFPVYIFGFEYFPNARFKYQGIVYTSDFLGFNNIFEFNTSVCKMSNDREMILLLQPLLDGAIIHNGSSSGYCWCI